MIEMCSIISDKQFFLHEDRKAGTFRCIPTREFGELAKKANGTGSVLSSGLVKTLMFFFYNF